MIISHKYKFIFIKTAKTAGTSIEVFLSQHCGEDDVLTPIWPHVEPHRPRNHEGLWNPIPEIAMGRMKILKQTLSDLARRRRFYPHIHSKLVRARVSGKIWNSYYKFCVERNPWDKTLSHFHMKKDRTGGTLTLAEYLERGSLCLNEPKYTDLRGNLIVDEVVKYESLTNDLARVFARLGIPFDGSLGVRAKSDHRKDRGPYQEIYTPEQRAVIERRFAKEIELHGYEF